MVSFQRVPKNTILDKKYLDNNNNKNRKVISKQYY